MNVDATYLDLIGKYLSGNLKPDEKTVLMTWVEKSAENEAFFDKMIQLWSVSGQYEEEADTWEMDTDAAWNKVEEHLFPIRELPLNEPQKRGRILNFPTALLRIAAVALIAIVAGYWWWSSPNGNAVIEKKMLSVATSIEEKRSITLPDGSEVWLNENSVLTYDSLFAERHVSLTGEAFFDVAHDENRQFVITSGETATTVLGTAFNVRAYPDEDRIEVTVERGLVKFQEKADESDEALLEKGTKGIFVKEEKEVKKIDKADQNATAWKTLRLNLNDVPVEQFEPTLERYFNVEIEVKKPCILKQKFYGTYEDPSLETLLETMAFSMDLEIDTVGKKITIDKKGDCN